MVTTIDSAKRFAPDNSSAHRTQLYALWIGSWEIRRKFLMAPYGVGGRCSSRGTHIACIMFDTREVCLIVGRMFNNFDPRLSVACRGYSACSLLTELESTDLESAQNHPSLLAFPPGPDTRTPTLEIIVVARRHPSRRLPRSPADPGSRRPIASTR